MTDESKLRAVELLVTRLEKVIYDLRHAAPLIASGGAFSHNAGLAIVEGAERGLAALARDSSLVAAVPGIAAVLSAFASAPSDPSAISDFPAGHPSLESKLSELAAKAAASDPTRQASEVQFGVAVAVAYSADRLDALAESFGRIFARETLPTELVTLVDTISAELIRHLAAKPRLLYQLRPRQFEELIAEILASFGWEVVLSPSTRDGGYDLFAIATNLPAGVRTSWLIECKKYGPEKKVGVEVVDALYGIASRLGIPNVLVATTGRFTAGVRKLRTSRYDLELKDYDGVLEWVEAYKADPHGKLYLRGSDIVPPRDR